MGYEHRNGKLPDHVDRTANNSDPRYGHSTVAQADATATKGPRTRDLEKKVVDSDKHYDIAAQSYKGNKGYGPNLGTVIQGEVDRYDPSSENSQDRNMTDVLKANNKVHADYESARKKNK